MSPLLKLLITAALLVLFFLFLSSDLFDVTGFEVEGNRYYSDEEILTLGGCKTGGNIFWGTGLSDIRNRLLQDPYMETVAMRRVLPATVRIEIEERRQTAAIVYGDEYVVIDSTGIVLRKTGVEPKVPVIHGLTISALHPGETIEVEERVQLRQTLELLEAMEANNMFFKKVEVSETELRAYVFDQLICRGTAERLIEAMEAGKLQLAVQTLLDEEIDHGTLHVSGEDFIAFSPKVD